MIRRPSPLARPRGGTLHWVRSPLMRAHLIFLLASACYILIQHPGALGPVLLIAATAVIGELAPASMRRFYLAEGLLLLSGIASFLWAWDADQHPLTGDDLPIRTMDLTAFQGWIRMVFVAWLLVPSRPGYLRWFAGLAGVELALRSREMGASDSTVILLVPAAVLALAWDAHLRVATLRPDDVQVGRSRPAGMLRWNGALIAVVSVAALVLGIYAADHSGHRSSSRLGSMSLPQPAGYEFGGINQSMHLGDKNFTDRNPVVAAKLTAETDFAPGTYYLRALTLPYLIPSDNRIRWSAATRATRRMAPRPTLHGAHRVEMATLFRRADAQDVVLLPDGAAKVGLEDMLADVDGNLYRPGLGDITTRYQVDLGAGIHPDPGFGRIDDGRNLAMPRALAERLERRLPSLRLWSQLEPQHAANAITAFLRNRCSYHLGEMPEPESGLGGDIMTFLFARDPDERIGHCQYFATTAVLLMRAAGHPARCVVGYASNEVEANEVVFRGMNAHAWAEFQRVNNGTAYWQRFDPTPPSHLQARAPDATQAAAEDPFEQAVPDANETEVTERERWRSILAWIGAGVLVTCFALLVWWLNRRHGASPRMRKLARSTEQLVSLAVRIGVPVDRHTTLSSVAAGVEARTGVDLGEHLRHHLAARFAAGPLPPPWPIAELKAAAKARQEARRAEASAERN